CVNACPNRAIADHKTVMATKCASYLTIEKHGEFSPAEERQIHYHLFGCDSCQLVCPWNKKLKALENSPFACDPKWLNLSLDDLAHLPESRFDELKIKSPLKRIKIDGIRRNARTILRNGSATE
ncbi:MAG: tRNA epoxyqueuosine(34) reductase QueG, partial [Deltaproteobacteria bacterium]|nr:tRNA epoxyqueuosine(34) reductase QueG [Deltaproteobacteria bacterium]